MGRLAAAFSSLFSIYWLIGMQDCDDASGDSVDPRYSRGTEWQPPEPRACGVTRKVNYDTYGNAWTGAPPSRENARCFTYAIHATSGIPFRSSSAISRAAFG